VIVEKDGKPLQRINSAEPFQLEVTMVKEAAALEEQELVTRLLLPEVRRPFDLARAHCSGRRCSSWGMRSGCCC